MLTDRPPRNAALLAQFLDSDRLGILEVPQDARLRPPAESIDSAMRTGKSAAVREACAEFLTLASDFYKVPKPLVRVLAARRFESARAAGPPSFLGTTLRKRR